MADLAQNDLNEALPALQEAISVGAFWICEILFSFIFFPISLLLWHSTFQRFGIMVFSTSHILKTFWDKLSNQHPLSDPMSGIIERSGYGKINWHCCECLMVEPGNVLFKANLRLSWSDDDDHCSYWRYSWKWEILKPSFKMGKWSCQNYEWRFNNVSSMVMAALIKYLHILGLT